MQEIQDFGVQVTEKKRFILQESLESPGKGLLLQETSKENSASKSIQQQNDEAEEPRGRKERVKHAYAPRVYFKICIFKASPVNEETLEKDGRGLGFRVIPGSQTSVSFCQGGKHSPHSLVSTQMNNSCLAPSSCSFFPGLGVLIYVTGEVLLVTQHLPPTWAAGCPQKAHIILCCRVLQPSHGEPCG